MNELSLLLYRSQAPDNTNMKAQYNICHKKDCDHALFAINKP